MRPARGESWHGLDHLEGICIPMITIAFDTSNTGVSRDQAASSAPSYVQCTLADCSLDEQRWYTQAAMEAIRWGEWVSLEMSTGGEGPDVYPAGAGSVDHKRMIDCTSEGLPRAKIAPARLQIGGTELKHGVNALPEHERGPTITILNPELSKYGCPTTSAVVCRSNGVHVRNATGHTYAREGLRKALRNMTVIRVRDDDVHRASAGRRREACGPRANASKGQRRA